ncbi:unnamed protein product [Arabis nemorensis]|uniref:DUF6821 domain-containing protein n=1 Tax=Arabis nemorensis TaxID=586526 RepID=A0A565C530_9BRAS|nr:unnamed protein product [Arabis nemorensis]
MDGDWEMVHGSDTESTDSITSDKISESSSVIDNGLILSDHFSVIEASGETTDRSENGDSFRIGSSDVYRSDDDGVRNESGFNDFSGGTEISGDGGEVRESDFDEKHPEIEAVAELVGGIEDASKCLSESDVLEEPIEDSSKCFSDSEGNEQVSGDSGVVNDEEEIASDDGVVASTTEDSQGSGENIVNCGEESKSRETVWWKMPFVLLKYSAFRIGPVWSVSMAAAVMGFVLLGRRLYNMKKKAQRFNLRVTIDEKKVSRVMSQAARLNEVFTEVRRVPVIRPALPSPGAWPALSLR